MQLDILLNDVVCENKTPNDKVSNTTNETRIEIGKKENESINNNVISYQANKKQGKSYQARKLQCLATRINETVHREFKTYVVNKYGKLNGVFSLEVETALRYYLDYKQQQTTNSTFFTNSKEKLRLNVRSNHERIVEEFMKTGSFPYFSVESIKQIVRSILGERDPRTFHKYLTRIRVTSKEKQSAVGLIFDVTKFCETTLGYPIKVDEEVQGHCDTPSKLNINSENEKFDGGPS